MADEGQLFTIRSAAPSPIQVTGSPEVYILSVFARTTAGSTPGVVVSGVAAATPAVQIALRMDDESVGTFEAPVDPAGGAWSLDTMLPSRVGIVAIEATDPSGAAAEFAHVHLTSGLEPVPPGLQANLDGRETAFLAGAADRLVRARSFALIESGGLFELVDPIDIFINGIEAIGLPVTMVKILLQGEEFEAEVNAKDYRESLKTLVEEMRGEFRAKRYDDKAIRRTAAACIDANLAKMLRLSKLTPAARGKMAKHPRGGFEHDLRTQMATLILPRLTPRSGLPITARLQDANPPKLLTALAGFYDRPSSVGICFDELFRFRPAGIVRGEPIYSLSLDAGEEVQLKQSSETVLSRTAEEVLELESEASLTLSSTWSTDVSNAFNEQYGSTSGWNIGGNAGLSGAPKVPVNVGISGGYSASAAAQNSIGVTVQTAYQMSREAMARLRAQHRTRMEVQEQTSIGVSSVRVLHNRDAVRPRRVDFFKVYRKEMATYERHDARMCLRLPIDDPAHRLRQEFATNLDQIDPDSASHYDDLPAPPATLVSTVTVPWHPNQPLTQRSYGLSKELLEIDIKSGSPAVPAHYVLLRKPSVRLAQYTVSQWYWMEENPLELTLFAESEGLVTLEPGIDVPSPFPTSGQDLSWVSPWGLETSSSTGWMQLDYLNYTTSEIQQTVVELQLEITSEWAPPSSELESFQQQREDLRTRIANELTAEKVLRLSEIAKADYLGEVVSRAMREHLGAGSLSILENMANPHDFQAWFAIEDAYFESAPYWATWEGNHRYALLRERVSRLNLGLPLSQVLIPELTASQAVLYLPIRLGAEEDALSLLGKYWPAQVDAMVKEFREYREQAFGPTAHASELPDWDAVSSPEPVEATPLGEPEWRTPWEPAQRKFQVLAQWADLVPTDGVDAQTVLSTTSKADEAVLRGIAESPRLR